MKDRRGFTLIEVMVVVGIIAIGLMIAVSNMQLWVRQTDARGFQREVFSRLQEARIRASSSGGRHRVVLDLANGTAVLQRVLPPATAWSNIGLPGVKAPIGSRIASVLPNSDPGSPVDNGTYAFVFNPSGDAYGQPTIGSDNSIALIDNAIILLTAANSRDDASITLFGWTGKARMK